jgi:hypothetical protein
MRASALAVVVLALSCAPAAAADPVLVAAGDIACNPDAVAYAAGDGTATDCHGRHTAAKAALIDPVNVLALGDLQYEDGHIDRFNQSYEDSWGQATLKSRTKPVPGNHEYGAGNSASNPPGTIAVDATAHGYFTYFATQLAAEGADAGNPQKGWYSFDVPVGSTHWHVVAINSECAAGLRVSVGWDGDCNVGSDQERWLRSDLAADRADCTIAYWHHPRFSSGGHGDNALMAPIWNALYDDYADVVLAGHDHDYERFAQADPSGGREPGRGIRSWVVGTGGKNEGALQPSPDPATELRASGIFGVLKLTLHGPGAGHPRGWFQWEFVDDGRPGHTPLADSGSGDCVGPPVAAKPAAAVVRPAAVRDTTAPLISLARFSRSRFRVGSRTTLGFTLSEAATATLRFDRRRRVRGRLRHRLAARLTRSFVKGRTRLRFTGRVGRKKLAPGLYRLTITAKDAAGNEGRPRRLLVRVLRRR